MLNRREALQRLLVITGGVMVLPSCLHQDEQASIPIKNFSFSRNDEMALADMTETLIPATDTKGAKDVAAHRYVLRMVDDCQEKDQQQTFLKGFREVRREAEKQYHQPFEKCTRQEKEALFKDLEAKKGFSKDAIAFYNLMKWYTIDGYMTSQYVMTKLVIYELVPGRFHGSYPISNQNNKA
jgi:hypothetical protein